MTATLPARGDVPTPVLQLRALVAADWHPRDLTARLGWDVVAILHGLVQLTAQVAEDVATLHDRLAGLPGTDPGVGQRARDCGWHAAGVWAAAGRPAYVADTIARQAAERPLDSAERTTAIARLAGLGLTDRQIGEVLGISLRGVYDHRRRHGIASGVGQGRGPRVDLQGTR